MHGSDVHVIVFMSFGLRKGIELVEALASGHTQDPKKVCLTGTVCFQECFSQGTTRGVRDR